MMNIKNLLLVLLFIVIAMPQSQAAFHIKVTPAVAATYEAQKSGLRKYALRWPAPEAVRADKCLVSKIGRGVIIGGGGLFVGGIIYGKQDAIIPIGIGLELIVVGVVLVIVGGIINAARKANKLSFVAPKNNEVGIAYSFR